MTIMGLRQNGKLICLADKEAILFETTEENLPEAEWLDVFDNGEEGEALDPDSVVERPVFDGLGSPNYWLDADGAMRERTEEEKENDPERLQLIAEHISMEARMAAMERAMLAMMEG